MPLIYVTGAPGVGKSTLQKELSQKGYETRDIDEPEFGGPHNMATGERVVFPPVEQRTPEWFEEHEWRVIPDAFKKLKAEAIDNIIVLCGVAASDSDVLHFFDKIIYLDIDDTVLTSRIKTRKDNDYGHNEFELDEIIVRKHVLDEKYAAADNVHVDANQPLPEVSAAIISQL